MSARSWISPDGPVQRLMDLQLRQKTALVLANFLSLSHESGPRALARLNAIQS